MNLNELCKYLDDRLDLAAFAKDSSNNGLQLGGKSEIGKVGFAVDACYETFAKAVAAKVDFLLVHHGISWGGEPRRFTGMTADRMRLLFVNDINLYAVHLPLDAHPELGNNIALAKMAKIYRPAAFCEYDGGLIGYFGEVSHFWTLTELQKVYELELGAPARLLAVNDQRPHIAAVVSGGGGIHALEDAAKAGADLLITGELNHVMYHCAKELNVNVLALGHYSSETVGVKAVMHELRQKFDLDGVFLDTPTQL